MSTYPQQGLLVDTKVTLATSEGDVHGTVVRHDLRGQPLIILETDLGEHIIIDVGTLGPIVHGEPIELPPGYRLFMPEQDELLLGRTVQLSRPRRARAIIVRADFDQSTMIAFVYGTGLSMSSNQYLVNDGTRQEFNYYVPLDATTQASMV
jgi:hypothetical protein